MGTETSPLVRVGVGVHVWSKECGDVDGDYFVAKRTLRRTKKASATPSYGVTVPLQAILFYIVFRHKE
jgi:hypothetical protein